MFLKLTQRKCPLFSSLSMNIIHELSAPVLNVFMWVLLYARIEGKQSFEKSRLRYYLILINFVFFFYVALTK